MPGSATQTRLALGLALSLVVACSKSEGSASGSSRSPGPAADPARSASLPTVTGPALDPSAVLHKLAFGSCLDQEKPQPIWDVVADYDPELFLMVGDNVYADAESVGDFVDAYRALAASEGFVKLRSTTPVLAVWDDHDYGRNDAGAEYPLKRQSERMLLDFFGEPPDSPRRTREGIYDSVVVGPEGRRVQIIMLDTRYFRTQLYPIGPGRYRDYDGTDATMLGQAQWAWLEARLREPAELRVLVSSVQVVANDHPHERWGVFVRERQRLLELIGRTKAAGVIVVSGDRHRGELSRLADSPAGYPIYDLTSSSLNRPLDGGEANRDRVGALVSDANVGTIDIVWEGQAHVVLSLLDVHGAVAVRHTVALDEIQPADAAP